ncbi:helix-turn-helix domain-containing protein [Salinibacter ruber]|uniref:helix-turn-helix domain-containing protein n=1 Tax=Salinibacter ruber TaxID=146919 RepID=UPI002167EE8F|nr:helix-turn-helix domain-containing protein [Salinibacter ruber]MCS3613391.1 excisionase family DNA binding protein [Salinibacter ruber]
MADKSFRVKEVAEALDRSPRTIRNHIQQGELPAAKVGRTYVITRNDLAEYLGSMDRVRAIFGDEEK